MLPPNPTAAPRGGSVWREDVEIERIAGAIRAAFPQLGDVALDDAAELGAPDGPLLVCTDAAVAGVHVDLVHFPAGDLGYRAVAATLSDLAAMGGRPLGVVVAVCAPLDADVQAIEAGALEACVTTGCPLLGGNLSSAVSAAVVAAGIGASPLGGAVRRSGASPGDALLVTGALGGSAAGRRARLGGAALDHPSVLAHRRPRVRLVEGQQAAAAGATAMLDVSDGLARDVRRLAWASGVAVALDEVAVADGASIDDALGGGEDYELVLTHPDPDGLTARFTAAGLAAPILLGEVRSGDGVTLNGVSLPDVGWRHGAPGGQPAR